jgi:hypothetical protein
MFKRPGSLSKSAFGISYASGSQQPAPAEQPQQPDAAHSKRPRSGQLPAEHVRRELLYLLETHATVVVMGETGCGKTTQIPKFLHEAGWTADGYQASAEGMVSAAAAVGGSLVFVLGCAGMLAGLAAVGLGCLSCSEQQHLALLHGPVMLTAFTHPIHTRETEGLPSTSVYC